MDIENDFVFTTNKKGEFQSGGYKLSNTNLGSIISPITSYEFNENETVQKGGNPLASPVFNNMAVPAGLFLLQQIASGKYNDTHSIINNNHKEKEDIIEESLYDKLLKLAENTNEKTTKQNSSNSKTKKNKKSSNSKTKKNKNKK
jgi:hypothetical protein